MTDPKPIFDSLSSFSEDLLSYEPKSMTIREFVCVLMAGAKTAQRSTLYYSDFPDADDVYRQWLAAMNRNMGNTVFDEPFDGIMLDMNDLYLKQIQDVVQKYLDDPDEKERLWHVDLSVLVRDPIRNFFAISECVEVCYRMIDAKVTEAIIPSPVGMNKALYFGGLYGSVWPGIASIFEQLSSKQYLYVKSAYLHDINIDIPFIKGEWPIPEEAGRKGLSQAHNLSLS